ncbi:hypothetical protein [Flammeovirga sp. SJP92]|uniref:hypothetical protein n=1 Tax=Flammeovirga sp. SJP92 TaxID=1775430 RepID=UPI0007912447|nr:hypothetical protein [Flammeovirga sp. SJP92]KXX71170.1 hypothetical protein AVL50_10075 [Flammeovirga sp. SJP92]
MTLQKNTLLLLGKMDKSEKIKRLIIDFENDKISSEKALIEINKLSNIVVDNFSLQTYNSSMDLEMYVRILTIESIVDWQEIDDKRAIDLINEILESTDDDAVLHRNFEALEKRYSKPTGTLSDWIFHDDITEANELLLLLKKNTTIIL